MSPWVSLHVFYYDGQDRLLLDGVRPLVDDLRRRALIDAFFFIRYYEEGPHVRLRLRPAADDAIPFVRDAAETAIGGFLARHPSQGRIAPRAGDAAIRPDNTFEHRVYEPELERYGGPAGLAISEEHFGDSSDVALGIIERTEGARERRLAAALQAMLIAAEELGVVSAEFMDVYCRTALAGAKLSEAGAASAVEQFARSCEQLRPALLAMAEQVHASGVWDAWRNGLRRTARQLANAEAAGSLTGEGPAGPRFLPSYIHMMNNRLGLPYSTEAQLAWFAARLATEREAAAV